MTPPPKKKYSLTNDVDDLVSCFSVIFNQFGPHTAGTAHLGGGGGGDGDDINIYLIVIWLTFM